MGRPKGSRDLKPRKNRGPQPLKSRARISAGMKGKRNALGTVQTPEAIAKRVAAITGSKRSAETRQRMRDAALLREHPRWAGDLAGYLARHKRIWSRRGKASAHPCVDCRKPAQDWSLVHGTDPLDVMNYDARCRACHALYDKHQRSPGKGAVASTQPTCTAAITQAPTLQTTPAHQPSA